MTDAWRSAPLASAAAPGPAVVPTGQGTPSYRDSQGLLHIMIGGEFPSGTEAAAGAAPPAAAAPTPPAAAAPEAWRSAPLAGPQYASGVGENSNLGRAAVRGIPIVGSFLDEAGAALDASVAPALNWALPQASQEFTQPTWDERYNAALTKGRGMDQAFDTAHPYVSTAAQLLGGTAATLPLGLTTVGAKMLGLTGDTMLGRVGAGAASGGGIGAVSGYGSGEGDPTSRLESAAAGGAMGAGLGLAAPMIGAGVGKVASAVMRGYERVKGAAGGSEPFRQAATMLGHGGEEPVTVAVSPHLMAAKELANIVRNDRTTPKTAAANPNAMFGELGPNAQEIAGGIVAQPGEGQTTIVDATVKAKAKAEQVVRAMMDRVLGRRSNVPQTIEDLLDERAAQSGPLYEKSLSHSVVWSRRLQQFLDDPIAKPALALGAKIQRLEALAENKPFNPTEIALDANGELLHGAVPNMRTLNVLKKGLDGLVEDSKNPITGRLSEQGRAIYKVLKAYRALLDEMNPEYAVARKAWEGPTKVFNALHAGQKVFDRSMSPDELAAELADMNDAERAGFIMGARQQIAQIMGTGRNDATAAVARFRQEWNPEKLRMLVGETEAKKVLDALDRMRAVSNFDTDVIHNSKTQARKAAQKALEGQSFARHTLGTGKVVFGIGGVRGLAKLGLIHLAEGLLGSHDEARNEQVAAIIARGMVKMGPERDDLIRALQRGLDRMSAIDRRSSGLATLLRALISSGGAATTPVLTRQEMQPAQ